ncbi:interaptin [Rhodamnia argentea]|uniref:Interaptin n=1 Tax=Rhodamnia argentea TaxID=178133 RepID=A0A8B8MSQ8_9MYRT|nr:interaptin [Rhodamnia argentea]
MELSTVLRSNLPSTSSPLYCDCQCYVRLKRKQQRLPFLSTPTWKNHSLYCVKSVLNNGNSRISDNGAAEPGRILLERLFAQTHKLEEMSKASGMPQDVQLDLNFEVLESDLHAALASLKKKEEDLVEAERKLVLEQSELNRATEDLEHREEVIAAALSRQEKLEWDLKQANLKLASQAREIQDLKLQLRDREQEIAASQSALSLKEDEIEKMKTELMKRSEDALMIESELKRKSQLLTEANEVITKQELELQELRRAVKEKEEELEFSMTLKKAEEDKLKVMEATLEKRTKEWLLVQEDLKKLSDEASKHAAESNETLEDLRRVTRLLVDVRTELISSQQSLVSSRQKMEEKEKLLEKEITELQEQKESIAAHMASLKDVQIEVESERVKLRVAEARNKELERDLSLEKELMEELQDQLTKERTSLQQAIQDKTLLQTELNRRNTEFQETQDLLRLKEGELVEAKLEIQHLSSQQTALQLMLEEKDVELFNTKKKLEELNREIEEHKGLMNGREDQLIRATNLLKEKEEHVQNMQNELIDTKLRCTDAESVVEQIVELTNRLVIPLEDKEYDVAKPLDVGGLRLQQLITLPTDDFRWKNKQLETEIDLTRENLRKKEMGLLDAQRALTLKDEELQTVLIRLDEREKELQRLKEEMTNDASDLRELYELAQQRVGEKSMGDLAIEKLQLEAAQLEVEAATSALEKLVEMTREFLGKASLSIEEDTSAISLHEEPSDVLTSLDEDNECFTEVKMEVAKLSALSEQLVKDAGIAIAAE